jgi:hypothetical protein
MEGGVSNCRSAEIVQRQCREAFVPCTLPKESPSSAAVAGVFA